MLHGQVVRPPAVGATVRHVDEDSVRKMHGIVKVVVKKNFVGVVAEKPWQAIQAARELKVDWTPGAGLPAQADFYKSPAKSKARATRCSSTRRDVEEKLSQRCVRSEGAVFSPLPDARVAGQFLRRGRCSRQESHVCGQSTLTV